MNEWLGQLRLRFNVDCRNGYTILRDWDHYGPFVIQSPFYPEGKTSHIYLLHPPGGLVGGDKLVLDVNLEDYSKVLLTTPSAAKFYRSNNGLYASLHQTFILNKNSSLEWLPQYSIIFPKSKVIINTVFVLKKGARLIGYDSLCFGRPALREVFNKGKLDSKLFISLYKSCGLRDRLRINDDCLIKIGGYYIYSMFFVVPANKIILDKIKLYLKFNNVVISGVTLIDNELLIVRLLSNDNRCIHETLYSMWSIVRPIVMGCKANPPRVWST